MIESITKERWQEAQDAERRFHTESFVEGFQHYQESYIQYFKYLNINRDLENLDICEIGPADFPALSYCENVSKGSVIIEPLPSSFLKLTPFNIITTPAEDAEYDVDEVWLMNVLQHVINPYQIVERAKKQAKVIRFFEPVNYGVNDCHPWNLTMEMFNQWFPGVVKYYPPNQPVKNFHTWSCAYGVWENKNI